MKATCIIIHFILRTGNKKKKEKYYREEIRSVESIAWKKIKVKKLKLILNGFKESFVLVSFGLQLLLCFWFCVIKKGFSFHNSTSKEESPQFEFN